MSVSNEHSAAQQQAPRTRAAEEGGGRASAHQPLDLVRRVLTRPELSATVGLIVVFAYFALTAGNHGFLTQTGTRNYIEVAAELGIIAVPVALLMIAGEFDLSVGSMVGAAGIIVSYPVVHHGWPLWAALLLGFAAACAIGFINGYIVVRTGLPSFIVTLAALYGLRGATLALTQNIAGNTSVDGIREATSGDVLRHLFGDQVFGFNVSIAWFVAVTVVGTWVLTRTSFGNWIYASGGDPVAARRAGVPVSRVKIVLFMSTALASTIVAVITSFVVDSANVVNGDQKEFQAITAAVIGGTLLTGGAGSPVGAALGAIVFGMVSQGFFFTNIDNNWFQTFIGGMLLVAVLVNTYIRSRSLKARRPR